jgi:hypothetical protein
MLAELAGLSAMGHRPPALSQGKTPEEDEKRLATVLMAGDRVIHIDNCERDIAGDFVCSMLTQEVVQARVLGASERRVLPCTALMLASGITSLSPAMCRGEWSSAAWMRKLKGPTRAPLTLIVRRSAGARPQLVVAGLTTLRAYVVAGRPVKLTFLGSFADWDWVRGALVWLGCADPADTRETVITTPCPSQYVCRRTAWALLGRVARSVDVSTAATSPSLPRRVSERGLSFSVETVSILCATPQRMV